MKTRKLALNRLGPWLGAILLTCLVLLALQWKLEFQWGTPSSAGLPDEPTSSLQGSAALLKPQSSAALTAPRKRPLSLIERIMQESEKIGMTTNDPKQVEQDLNQWAQRLSSQDITDLRQLIFEGGHSGDEIALSLDLLGRRPLDPESAQILLDYILRGPSNETTEKSTFQLLALEGLIDHSLASRDPSKLRRIQKESPDALLSRRAGQALGALHGRNPSPSETDQKALTELLEKSSR
ncbi:MAG: hypothetical protein ACK5P7_06050 [Bdellovibrio sp.]